MKKKPVKTTLYLISLTILSLGGLILFAAGMIMHSVLYRKIAIVCFALYFTVVGTYDKTHMKKAPILFYLLAMACLCTLFLF